MTDPHYFKSGKVHIIHDPELLDSVPENLFVSQAENPQGTNTAGRGTVFFFRHKDLELVLKRYHRGGMVRHLIQDSYCFRGVENSRMFREFHLLQQLQQLGLPVPSVIAARCVRNSLLSYRGELLMSRIPQAQTLGEMLIQTPLENSTWEKIGQTLARFHQKQVCHADLNANNIMLDQKRQIFLIDFDKGEIRSGQPDSSWKKDNLARLLRSLHKLQSNLTHFNFEEKNWQTLEQAYTAALDLK